MHSSLKRLPGKPEEGGGGGEKGRSGGSFSQGSLVSSLKEMFASEEFRMCKCVRVHVSPPLASGRRKNSHSSLPRHFNYFNTADEAFDPPLWCGMGIAKASLSSLGI